MLFAHANRPFLNEYYNIRLPSPTEQSTLIFAIVERPTVNKQFVFSYEIPVINQLLLSDVIRSADSSVCDFYVSAYQ